MLHLLTERANSKDFHLVLLKLGDSRVFTNIFEKDIIHHHHHTLHLLQNFTLLHVVPPYSPIVKEVMPVQQVNSYTN